MAKILICQIQEMCNGDIWNDSGTGAIKLGKVFRVVLIHVSRPEHHWKMREAILQKYKSQLHQEFGSEE